MFKKSAFFASFFLLLLYYNIAHANCTLATLGACTTAGRWDYDTSNNTYRFCNGTSWVSMAGAGTSGTCSIAGSMDYDNALSNYKFCNGANWIPVAGTTTSDSCASARAIDYDAASNRLRWCNGANWVDMARLQAGAVGTVCSDGSVYAGLSPDGNVPMYTTPADSPSRPWNNGNSSGYVNLYTPTTQSTTGGEASTAAFIGVDSDSGAAGTQPFQAPAYCDGLSAHGKSDWYVPASDEFSVLRANRAAIGGFSSSYYWTATEVCCNAMWYGDIAAGTFGAGVKNFNNALRCVRK